MLNWAGFSGLMMILAGPFSGVAAAHQHKVGASSLILFGIVGLVIGFGISMASSKIAYRVLASKTLPAGLQFAAYMFIPMFSLLLVIFVPALLAIMVYGQT